MLSESEFLYRIHPTRSDMPTEGTTTDEQAIIAEHFEYLKRLVEQGIVLHAGRTLPTNEDSFGIVIFRASSESEARGIMEHDPAVREGVMRAVLFPYRIALMSHLHDRKGGERPSQPVQKRK